jgi:hypothetical protein
VQQWAVLLTFWKNLLHPFSGLKVKKDTDIGTGTVHIVTASLSHLVLMMRCKRLRSAPFRELPFFPAHHEQTHHHYLNEFYTPN